MAKSWENKADNLQFPWDHKAEQTLRAKQIPINLELNLDRYFDWLAEIQPCRKELDQTKIFKQTFRLRSR